MRLAKTLSAFTVAILTATALTACSSTETDSTGAADAVDTDVASNPADPADFPVTVSHAFGETIIESVPERIAAVGWANHEVPLALGVVPVGMSKATWGDDDDNGILPWVEDELTQLDAGTPVLFDETDSIPFEQIADTSPDIILAAYSGITQDDYDQLSKIAPVVAYPDQPWKTSLQEMVELNSVALGLEQEGIELNDNLEEEISSTFDSFPALQGKTALFTSFGGETDQSTVGFYTEQDPRAGFLADIGLGVPEVVQEASIDSDSFWEEVSAENPELFDDVDLLVSYGSADPAVNEETLASMQEDPLLSRIPAISNGNVAFLPEGPLAASSNPSPLSIPWGLQDYLELLNSAAE
ncbi:iron-siderophore ABC transporter substrate-binding protein [Corynebacterium alimapuense]|uniref:ABC transporter substrate-binding protein n=1 Tax=Corynebacterium alimapuense TaxID=1576874 RepID=A0A3M8K7S8_9CORY|nr:iron-siderophore ABC transporter substrate-binding protein [Corynebacterium alimapuense]RNE48805.1 ABC transporter substrate-binding protein [Corynebacterium alimapuense]